MKWSLNYTLTGWYKVTAFGPSILLHEANLPGLKLLQCSLGPLYFKFLILTPVVRTSTKTKSSIGYNSSLVYIKQITVAKCLVAVLLTEICLVCTYFYMISSSNQLAFISF